MTDKIIVPYVKDEEHAAPKHLRLNAYAQIHLTTSNQAGNSDNSEEVVHAPTRVQNSK